MSEQISISKLKTFDITEYLETDEMISEYLNQVLDDGDSDDDDDDNDGDDDDDGDDDGGRQ